LSAGSYFEDLDYVDFGLEDLDCVDLEFENPEKA
jgi:hypothetical protein